MLSVRDLHSATAYGLVINARSSVGTGYVLSTPADHFRACHVATLTPAEAGYRQLRVTMCHLHCHLHSSDNVPFVKHGLHPSRPLCFNQAAVLSRSLVVSSRSLAFMLDSLSHLDVIFFSKARLFLQRLRHYPVPSNMRACIVLICERAYFEVQKLEMVTF